MSRIVCLFFSLSVVALLNVGCGKGTAPAPERPVAANGEPAASVSEPDMAPILAELTQAVRKYSVENRKVPQSLNEVVAAGYIRNLPQAPPGRSFRIDAKNVKVVLR